MKKRRIVRMVSMKIQEEYIGRKLRYRWTGRKSEEEK